jgi:hypothetical protein
VKPYVMNKVVYSIVIVGLFLAGVSALTMMMFSEHQQHGSCGGICINSPFIWLPILTALGCVVGAIAILFAVREEKHKIRQDALELVLTDEEQSIIGEIEKVGGEITQQELGWRMKISKVKVHRIVARLQKRNIIEKIPYGKTNLLRLKKTS